MTNHKIVFSLFLNIDYELNSNYSIYFNQDKSSLKLTNIKLNSIISVVATDGKVVSKVISKDKTVEFNVSRWGKGVYVFFIESEKNTVVKKVIVQ